MKINLIHYTAPPVVGGVETILSRQASQLAHAGHQVQILTGRGRTWDAQIPVETVNMIDFRHPQVLRAKASLDQGIIPPDFAVLVDQIQTELRRLFQGPQVVIAHNVASLHKNLPLTAALFNLSQENRPSQLILWHHDLAWKTESSLSELHDGWPWDLLRTAWPGVKQVAVSEVRRQELAALFDLPMREINVVPAGLDLVDFLGLPKPLAPLVNELHLTGAAPILLCPVGLNRSKNLELALQTLAELRQRMPQAALIVTGPPSIQGKSYLKSLKKLRDELGLENAAFFMAERFPKGLSEAGLLGFYRLADALLLTSREEGFGVPLLEAGLSGIPIFCSNLDSLQALAGENAAFFSLGDPPKQVAALIAGRLLSDPVYRMRVRVRQEFTWEGIYRKQLLPLLEI